MMAQDFHDLTGQVIARVVQLAATIEEQLMELLLQSAPGKPCRPGARPVPRPARACGRERRPSRCGERPGRVDDLLASLGF